MYYFSLLALLFISNFDAHESSVVANSSNPVRRLSNGTNIKTSTNNHSLIYGERKIANETLAVANSSNPIRRLSNDTIIKTSANNNSHINSESKYSNETLAFVNSSSTVRYLSNDTDTKTSATSNSLVDDENEKDNETLAVANSSTTVRYLFNDTNTKTSANNNSLGDDESGKGDETLAVAKIDEEADLAGVCNIHFHLTVPRYYSPYEEVPFLYFINSSNTTYTDQEKHYFSIHMGSNPFSPTYGLLLSNLSNGSHTFHIGRAYNQTWVADAVNAADNTSFIQTINVSDTYSITSYEINVQVWSDLYGEKFYQSKNSSLDRIFLLRAHYKSIDCDIKRRIWIYLPPDYEKATSKRYPVVYTHWGQLMFNYYGNSKEWGLDRLLNDAFNNVSSCKILKWGLIIVAIEALPTKLISNMEYIVSREESGCRSQNLIRTFSGSFKRHIHANFRTINQWDFSTVIGYGTAGGLAFDQMTKYYHTFGKFIILSWILDEDCCESEVEINDALATSHMFRTGGGSQKNATKKNRPFPKVFFTWTLDEEPAEITRARDNAKGLKFRGMPASNVYVDPVNTSATAAFYGAQTIKAFCWLFSNQSAESFSDIAPWWNEEQIIKINNEETTTKISQM